MPCSEAICWRIDDSGSADGTTGNPPTYLTEKIASGIACYEALFRFILIFHIAACQDMRDGNGARRKMPPDQEEAMTVERIASAVSRSPSTTAR